MADDLVRLRVRDRFIKNDKFKKLRWMSCLNERGTRRGDHDYVMRVALPQPLALETNHGDAIPIDNIASNVTVSTEAEQTRGILWNEGSRRVVELELLAEQRYCNRCNAQLHLNDIVGEMSLLEVVCRICSDIKLLSTGKRNEKGGFDINSKVALGLFRNADITRLTAYNGKNSFNQFVASNQNISTSTAMITGISYSFDKKQMCHHGQPVESIGIKIALLTFIKFISEHNSPVLVGHNRSSYDNHILCKQLKQNNLLAEFLRLINGCIDTLKLARKMFKKEVVGNYKQQNLVTKLLGKSYNAHDALEDVKGMHELFVNRLQYTCKDIFTFNQTQLVALYKDIINKSLLTKTMACRMANSGICLKHLELAHKRDLQMEFVMFFWNMAFQGIRISLIVY